MKSKAFKFFRALLRNRPVRTFLTDFTQGVAQDEVQDRLGVNKPVVGPPSLGGVVATGARNGSKFVWDAYQLGQLRQQVSNGQSTEVDSNEPPLNPQRLRILGIRQQQAQYLSDEDFDKIDSDTLQVLQGVLDLPSDLVNTLQREQVQVRQSPLEKGLKV